MYKYLHFIFMQHQNQQLLMRKQQHLSITSNTEECVRRHLSVTVVKYENYVAILIYVQISCLQKHHQNSDTVAYNPILLSMRMLIRRVKFV